ncbi:MAG: hypothetical protein HZC42_10085 [Candidatus Eisenbacteria bacterium]|nr:hypothetical protein [Candidatus Eisenbacteria bacterium]
MPIRPLFFVASALALLAAPFAGAAGPPVQLVETRPVETRLGNPALPAALPAWLEMIGGATTSLDFEEFYVSTWPGEPLEEVLAAIGQAAGRGVRVRILVDARMHATYPRTVDSLGTVPGIAVRVLDMGRISGGVLHAKFFLVDGREVFLGSQNFDWRALKHIHELGVRVRDPRVAGEFARLFAMDWAAGTAPGAPPDTTRAPRPAPPPGARLTVPVRIVQAPGDTVQLWPGYSPRGFIPDSTLWDRDAIVRLLDSARREIVVQVLTYAPESRRERDEALDQALRRAAVRGVAVKLLVSDWEADGPGMASLQSLAEVPKVEVRLSVVPEWSGGYIPFARVEHCKYAVVDSARAWVGTSNWEPGYFHGTRNVAVTLWNRPLALQARRVFEASWAAPQAIRVRPGERYPARVHGSQPPPGKSRYGE